MLLTSVKSASMIWNAIAIASTMTNKAEFFGRPTVQRCFISVFKHSHANFAILLEMTEPKTVRPKKISLRVFSNGKSKSCFRRLDKKKVISFLDLNCNVIVKCY